MHPSTFTLPFDFIGLVSGGGTTVTEIIKACYNGGPLDGLIKPVAVIASKAGLGAEEKVKKAGLDPKNYHVVPRTSFPKNSADNGEAFGKALIAVFNLYNPRFVGQHGFLPKTPSNFIAHVNGNGSTIYNQHPVPLRKGQLDFGGEHMRGKTAVCATLAFARLTNRNFNAEVTAHLVTDEVDGGEVIGRTAFTILPGDDVESLQTRGLVYEHALQIEVLRQLASDTLKPLPEPKPLVRPGEEYHWATARAWAHMMYPKG